MNKTLSQKTAKNSKVIKAVSDGKRVIIMVNDVEVMYKPLDNWENEFNHMIYCHNLSISKTN